MSKYEVMGIELIKGNDPDGKKDGLVYHLCERIESGEGCKPTGRVYSRDGFYGINVGDVVVADFAQSRNGWYIKSLRKE